MNFQYSIKQFATNGLSQNNYISISLILFLSLIYTSLVNAQSDSTQNNWIISKSAHHSILQNFHTYDTNYIKNLSSKYTFVVENSNWLDFYHIESKNNNAITLQSDLNYNLGFSLGYKSLLAGYSFSLTNIISDKAVSNRRWELFFSNNLLSFNMQFVNNRGQTNVTSYEDNDGLYELHIPFDNLQTKIFETDLYYFFNKHHYSNMAAYSKNYIITQIKSAGSIIFGISFARQQIFFDFTTLSQSELVPISSLPDTLKIDYTNYALNMGYGYNYVFSTKWLTNITVIPSIGINNVNENTEYQLSFNTKIMTALVYNTPRYFGAISCRYYINRYFADTYLLTNSIGSFILSFGWRF